jgi:VWFA-related protein
MQNWPLPFLAVLATLAVAFPARVAAGPAAGEITSVDTTQYPLVTLSVPIVDEAGNAVTGLTAENFTIQQDGKEATIESVDAAIDTDIGAGVVVVIDISGSMAGPPIEAAKAAAISFVGSLSPSDLVAVVAFSDSVQLVQPFTADKAATTAVIQGLNVFGDTALFEAANQSLDFALQSGLSRQAVVLLSDGANDDPDGGPAPDLVLARASKMGIPIFAVALGAAADATFTQQLADVSGGVAYRANSPAELSGLYGAMAERLNSEYIVRYQAPPGVGEQTITVVAEAGGNTYTAEAALDVLWSATSEEGGPTVRLPEFKPGSTVDRDLVVAHHRVEHTADRRNRVRRRGFPSGSHGALRIHTRTSCALDRPARRCLRGPRPDGGGRALRGCRRNSGCPAEARDHTGGRRRRAAW